MRNMTTLESLKLQREVLVIKMNKTPEQMGAELRIFWKKLRVIDEQINIEMTKEISEARKFAQFLIKTSK